MSPRTQLIGVAIAIAMLLLVLELVRRRRLRVGYSLIWLIIGAGAIVLIAAPPLVNLLARLIGISDPRSLIFTAGIAFSFWILLDHSLTLTRVWRQDKDLAQAHALLEWRVRDLQARLDMLTAQLAADSVDEQRQPAQINGRLDEHAQQGYTLIYQTEEGFHEPQA